MGKIDKMRKLENFEAPKRYVIQKADRVGKLPGPWTTTYRVNNWATENAGPESDGPNRKA